MSSFSKSINIYLLKYYNFLPMFKSKNKLRTRFVPWRYKKTNIYASYLQSYILCHVYFNEYTYNSVIKC